MTNTSINVAPPEIAPGAWSEGGPSDAGSPSAAGRTPVAFKRDATGDSQPDDAALNLRLLAHGAHADWRYREVHAELRAWVGRFNDAFFGRRLPPPAVSIGRDRRSRLGTYQPGRDVLALRHRIHMNAGHLSRPKAHVLRTLLHELLHQWEEIELGRGPVVGNYHTAAFVQRAAEFGIPVQPRTGISRGIPADGRFARLLAEHGTSLDGVGFVVPPPPATRRSNESRSSIRPWTCGCTRVWTARGVELRAHCDGCGGRFVRTIAGR